MTIASGDLLIAPPTLTGTAYAGAVIMLASTNPTMGFVLNRPTGTPLSRIAPKLEQYMDTDIYWGGPVNVATIWMLHTNDWSMRNSVEISADMSVTSNMAMFDRLANGDWPEYWRVFAGSSVWTEGQLESEIIQLTDKPRSQGWLTAHTPDPHSILGVEHRDLWQIGCELAKEQAVSQWI